MIEGKPPNSHFNSSFLNQSGIKILQFCPKYQCLQFVVWKRSERNTNNVRGAQVKLPSKGELASSPTIVARGRLDYNNWASFSCIQNANLIG